MNAGEAITRAMKLDRNTDLLSMLVMLTHLHDGLLGWYWGWYGPDVAVRGHRAQHLHGWRCERAQINLWPQPTGRCTCSLLAYRTPAIRARAERDLDAGWEPPRNPWWNRRTSVSS